MSDRELSRHYAVRSDRESPTTSFCSIWDQGDEVQLISFLPYTLYHTEIDTCSPNPCHPLVQCFEVQGSQLGFRCGSCPEGYTGNGINCTSLCPLPCPYGMKCVGSYTCRYDIHSIRSTFYVNKVQGSEDFSTLKTERKVLSLFMLKLLLSLLFDSLRG